MSIQLQCEGCGKTIKAPREAAGKQAKCPACGHPVYIPSPEDEIDELPLAAEDVNELKREQALLEERRRLDRILAKEDRTPPEGSAANPPRTSGSVIRGTVGAAASTGPGSEADLESMVVEYLKAMRDSDLARADTALNTLLRQRTEARAIVERLVADQIPPPDMTRVPSAVYQGFLRNLRSQL
jgi:hypothetical protein